MYEGRILADVPGERGDRAIARPADGRPALRRRRRERQFGVSSGGSGARRWPHALTELAARSSPRSSSRIVIGGILVFVSGANPSTAYFQILVGALAAENLPNTLNWAVPLVGMTLVAAIPLRGGMINLGGDGQMVIGGLVAALVPLYCRRPGRC